ncbi:peptidase C14 caspase catalytic subunit p20 [Pseudopedobacter saltans DSM 12145]|uniref:Peptidase C14 caspase catalytic subunit p20 n=1 Tax=Pseudopedobacter saltans (strain ATCC 51119 / DSM 12145 / JCM 21818 / CCUG 39354 / LMG 10337 / NBRC 100064 / NCIMB 13643) TaxID=762903 RepID=F0S9A3_PSESL|nr:caspase family protein [Pseudopedobacter saltans]ADY52453.1 peptidase C14 caspase catalytic subunit p20 [Pseudopedobacter saltans DSM 12145]
MNKIIAIAIDEYSDPTIKNLQNCIKDINLLIDTLSNLYEFDSFELFTKPEQTTLSFLYDELYNEFINSVDSDNILLLFAGHGEFNPNLGTTYWLCSDSKKNSVTTWFNLNDLLKFFSASPAKHIALISDSCFSGAIFEINRGGGTVALDGKFSRQALTSGGLEKVSDGIENSPFNTVLIDVLKDNTSEKLSFNQLSERTILQFNQKREQTPEFGSLISSGDKGGTFFFKRKLDGSSIIKSIQIPLEINQEVKIDSTFEIPFFNENKYFNNNFINAFVQQLGYSIINDVRVFITEDEGYSISRSSEMEFYLEVGYNIHTLNEKFLSVTIGRSDYFGGAHPNHYIYSINFAFKPDRKISLYDILDYSNFSNLENFLSTMIDQYGDEECKEILNEYSTFEYTSQLDFYFNDTIFTIDFMNLLPHAFKGCGSLEIPIDKIKFKI